MPKILKLWSQVFSLTAASGNGGNRVLAIRDYDKLCHDINASGSNIGIVGQLLWSVFTIDISYSIKFVKVL